MTNGEQRYYYQQFVYSLVSDTLDLETYFYTSDTFRLSLTN